MPRRGKKSGHAKKETSNAPPRGQPKKGDPDASRQQPKKDEPDTPRYYYNPGKRVDITLDKDGGLLKEVVKPGTGEFLPTKGSRVFIHYVGFTSDNVIFYNTKDLREPRSFSVGEGTCVRGIEQGVKTMRKGEVAIFTCKLPYYSGICLSAGTHTYYMRTCSKPPFGPQHLVYFKVELLAWKDSDISVTKDGGIMKRMMELGEGSSNPSDGTVVDIHFTCEHNNKTVEDRKVVFCLGEGKKRGIPRGIEVALKTFKVKEKSRLIMSSDYAWGPNEKPRFGIPPKSKVTYYVKLNRILKSREVQKDTIGERLLMAIAMKEQGSELYRIGVYPAALVRYANMLECLEGDVGTLYQSEDSSMHFVHDDVSEENNTLRDNLKLIGYLNIAACLLKLEAYDGAQEACDKALAINAKNEKGLYRRAQAYMGMGDMEKAAEDFEAVLKINPNNTAAENNLDICKEKKLINLVHEREFFRSMFM